jgi:hypothetical protein
MDVHTVGHVAMHVGHKLSASSEMAGGSKRASQTGEGHFEPSTTPLPAGFSMQLCSYVAIPVARPK